MVVVKIKWKVLCLFLFVILLAMTGFVAAEGNWVMTDKGGKVWN